MCSWMTGCMSLCSTPFTSICDDRFCSEVDGRCAFLVFGLSELLDFRDSFLADESGDVTTAGSGGDRGLALEGGGGGVCRLALPCH